MANNKEFLVSVGKAIMRDPTTGAGLGYGAFNLESALTMSMEEAQVRGGIGNPVLYTYKHSKKLDAKITDATFSPDILSMNAGTNVYNGSITAVATDCLVLSASGSATLANTPTSTNVEVFFEDGTVQSIAPVGSVITTSGGANLKVTAIYDYSVTADRIRVETNTPPKVIDLTLIAEVRDADNVLTDYMQIIIPRFQVSGNYTLSMTADGVSTQALEGTALQTESTDCTNNSYYADVIWIPVSTTAPSVYALAMTPDLTFSVAAGLPASKQLTLNGLRGGQYLPTNLTTSASYAVTSGSTTTAAYVNVGANTGLVTAGSSVGVGWTGIITASYTDATHGLLHDYITFTVTA